MDPNASQADTAFASAARATLPVLAGQRIAFLAEPIAAALLEAMPGPAMVLNRNRQVVAANALLLEALGQPNVDGIMGARPGEMLECRNSRLRPGGCGTSPACAECGAVNAILESFSGRARVVKECRISTTGTANGGSLEYRVHATFVTIEAQDFVIVGLEDISSEKRRRVLERTFFHDLLNTCGGVLGLAEILEAPDSDPSEEPELKRDIRRLSAVVVDQIESQRTLLAAEQGVLKANLQDVDVASLVQETVALYRHHPVAQDRELVWEGVGPYRIHTDRVLLGRIAGNLIKNALEATPSGGKVTVTCELEFGIVTIAVHNDGVIPEPIQQQIFQRSFSTKGGEGRGVGTYSVKLFTEQFLRGSVQFVSNDKVGTLFMIMIPDRVGELRAAA